MERHQVAHHDNYQFLTEERSKHEFGTCAYGKIIPSSIHYISLVESQKAIVATPLRTRRLLSITLYMYKVYGWYSPEGTHFKPGFILECSGYTQEKIRNLNDHCNDDCNSSLELSDLAHERKFVT